MKWHRIIVLLALCVVCSFARAQALPVSEEAIAKLQVVREALFDTRRIDIPQLSDDIRAAIRDGEQLEREGKYETALERLLVLQKYSPLLDLPSFDVHMLAGWLYGKLGQADASQQHRQRAAAYRALLGARIGSGTSADDPLRVVMHSEAVEWLRSRLARVVDFKSNTYGTREIMVFTYQGPVVGSPPQQLFVEIDPRTRAQANARIDRFKPIPVAEMPPKSLEWMRVASEKRNRFLNDSAFPYLELRHQLDELMKRSAELHKNGKLHEALAVLGEVERIRPIEEVPTPRWLIWYSYLMGRTGNVQKQSELRGLIFGVQQVIAHSGDGRTAETAVHVLFIDEEYDWLAQKKLKLGRQSLRHIGGETYDVMSVTDTQGVPSDIYFNITRMYAKYSQITGSDKAN
ncbi:MAG TPA: DUF4919 domain-containing protein [Burkholderiaceae bacterium]|nr:DUF4919 domain-containing protein [Burkholderiaceae bacterium]